MRVLNMAMRSPSGGNLQPWKLHVMTGETLAEFKKRAAERTLAGKLEEPTYAAYPSPLWEPGLHTAPQGWWRNWTSVCHELLDIPDEEEVMVGIAIGYGNADAPVNELYADRAGLDEVAKFYT